MAVENKLIGNVVEGVGDAVNGVQKGGGVPVKPILATTAVVGGGGALAGYVIRDGNLYDAAGNLVQDINEVLGLGSARAGARTWRETLWAYAENLGMIINNIFGGDTALGFINLARNAQNGLSPMVFSGGKLVPKNELSTSTDENNTNATTLSSDVVGSFNFEARIITDLERTEIFNNQEVDSSLNNAGVSVEQLTHAEKINRTIKSLDTETLVNKMERTFRGDNPEQRAQVELLDNSENIADFQLIQARGLEGLNALFTSIASGQDAGEALTTAKTTLGISASAPVPGNS